MSNTWGEIGVLNKPYPFFSLCLLRFCQVICVKWFNIYVVHWHIWPSCCSLMSGALFFCFFPANSIGLLSPLLLWCWWRLFVSCELHHTPFLFPEPHTVWHPPTCSTSSLLLAAPLLTCLVQFGSRSCHILLSVAWGHFTVDASTIGFLLLLLLLKLLTV